MDFFAEELTQTENQIVDQSLDLSIKNEMEFLRISTTNDSVTTDEHQNQIEDIVAEDQPTIGCEYIDETIAEENSSEVKNTCEQSIQSESNVTDADPEVDRPVASKYPLKYRWQLWFWRANQGVKVVWTQALQKVCQPFDTIEGFWRLYHHILCVHQLGNH